MLRDCRRCDIPLQAAKRCPHRRPRLDELAAALVDIGDEWREFALATARMIRDRAPLQPRRLGDLLRGIADREQAFFRDLRRTV